MQRALNHGCSADGALDVPATAANHKWKRARNSERVHGCAANPCDAAARVVLKAGHGASSSQAARQPGSRSSFPRLISIKSRAERLLEAAAGWNFWESSMNDGVQQPVHADGLTD